MAQSLHLFSYLLWCFRYANMDYLFFASLVGITLWMIIISYNIACQWGSQLSIQMNAPSLPSTLHLLASTLLWKLVPKFHLPSHTNECQAPFLFNFALGVGQTDGKGVEQNWPVLNGVACKAPEGLKAWLELWLVVMAFWYSGYPS